MVRCLFAALLVISFGTMSSCHRYTTVACQTETLQLRYKGFQVDQLDTVTLGRYEKGSCFSKLARTIYLPADSTTFAGQGDTLVPLSSLGYGVLAPGDDYEVLIPATGNAYRVSDIELEGRATETYREAYGVTYDRDPCINRVVSFRLDSTTISTLRGRYENAYVVLIR